MKQKQFGKTDLVISPLVFGANVFGWTIDKKKSFEILDAFVEQGFNCIDTADVYSTWANDGTGGQSESIIGEWMKARNNRSKMIIATKVGMEMGPAKKGLSRTYINEAIESSLKRLQTDYIDLYQSHVEDLNTPIEETLEAYTDLIKAGKIRYIGASNYSPEGLTKSLQVSKNENLAAYQTYQPRYNLCDREEFEKNHASICETNQLGVIPYFSLASGFLTGKYRSVEDLKKSTRGPRVAPYLNERGFKILDAIEVVAKKNNVTSTQIAIAWLNHNKYITAALASATSVDQLKELIKGATLALDDESMKFLNEASSY